MGAGAGFMFATMFRQSIINSDTIYLCLMTNQLIILPCYFMSCGFKMISINDIGIEPHNLMPDQDHLIYLPHQMIDCTFFHLACTCGPLDEALYSPLNNNQVSFLIERSLAQNICCVSLVKGGSISFTARFQFLSFALAKNFANKPIEENVLVKAPLYLWLYPLGNPVR